MDPVKKEILSMPILFKIHSALGGEVEQLTTVPAGIVYDPLPGANVLFYFGAWGYIICQFILLDGVQIWDTQYELLCAVELSSRINLAFIELHNSVKNAFVNNWEQVQLHSERAGQSGFTAGPYIHNTVLFPGKASYRTTDFHFTPAFLVPFANAYPRLYEVMNRFERNEFAQFDQVLQHGKESKSILHQIQHPKYREPVLPIHYLGKANEFLCSSLETLDPLILPFPRALSPEMNDKAEELEAIIRKEFRQPLQLSSFTRRLASTEPYLQAAFKQRYGKTCHQYLRDYRIEKVKAYLLDTNDDLESIAVLTHFHDGAHLGNVFKALVGETPSEYRKYRRSTDLS